ncbi:MAG: TVP38/TMEM64 family protein [Oscillospiraceae bacterium]
MEKDRKLLFGSEATPERRAKIESIKRIMRVVGAVIILAAFAGMVYLLYPILKGFGSDGWLEGVEQRISEYSGIEGIFVFLMIQAMQVIVAVIPAVQVVGGVLYGWFFGALLSFGGIIIGTLFVWLLVKKIGAPLVEAVVSEKNLKKFSFIENERKVLSLLMLLYLIPAIPKDVITYLVPLTKIKMKDFFFYVLPWRIPAILLSTIFGSNVTKGNYGAAVVIVCIIIVVVIAGVACRGKILDRREERDVTNSDK